MSRRWYIVAIAPQVFGESIGNAVAVEAAMLTCDSLVRCLESSLEYLLCGVAEMES